MACGVECWGRMTAGLPPRTQEQMLHRTYDDGIVVGWSDHAIADRATPHSRTSPSHHRRFPHRVALMRIATIAVARATPSLAAMAGDRPDAAIVVPSPPPTAPLAPFPPRKANRSSAAAREPPADPPAINSPALPAFAFPSKADS